MNTQKYSLELDTEAPLLQNLNAVEALLRELDILKESDSLIAITDNPLDPSSVTIGEGITISALNSNSSGETLSVLNKDADITVANSRDSED